MSRQTRNAPRNSISVVKEGASSGATNPNLKTMFNTIMRNMLQNAQVPNAAVNIAMASIFLS